MSGGNTGYGHVLRNGRPLRSVESFVPIRRSVGGRVVETTSVMLTLECGCQVNRSRPVPRTAACERAAKHGRT